MTHLGGVSVLTERRRAASACAEQKEGHDVRCCEVPQWIHHPATWIIATLAVAGLLGRLIYWMGTVDTDRKNFRSLMEEVRADVKQILGRLPPVAVASPRPPSRGVVLTSLAMGVSPTGSCSASTARRAYAVRI